LRWSDDGGHTWSNQVFQSVGAQGQTGKRVIWRRLGMTTKLRDRVYEISASGWGKTAIMGAELIASGTNA
jgi:ABC-type ATPase with predicted acetyltransferase domain